jgi:hypothetical protein
MIEQTVELGALAIDPHRESFEAALGNDAGAQAFEDVLAVALADHRLSSRT